MATDPTRARSPLETSRYLDEQMLAKLKRVAGGLIATDDDTYTYNKRVNRIPPIQEHRMIARAMDRGVAATDIAEALNLQVESVIRRFRLLESRGYREIVITGVNLSSYSAGGRDLTGLLQDILSGGGNSRIRLSSLEPEAVTDGFADVLRHPRICPHFHLPVQSGSDPVLRAMRRRYNRAAVSAAVSRLRALSAQPPENEPQSLPEHLLHVYPFLFDIRPDEEHDVHRKQKFGRAFHVHFVERFLPHALRENVPHDLHRPLVDVAKPVFVG